MEEIIKINYESEQPTVSARELHEGLEIKSNFTTWFDRMCEYGFTELDFKKCFPNLESGCNGGQNMVDYEISIDMAKQICMVQRTEKGKQYRQYFLDLEKAWNAPEQVMARALKIANNEIDKLKADNRVLIADTERMNPKQYFLEKAMPEIVKVVVDVATAMVRVLCKLNGTLWEIARVRMANANLLKNLTEQRKQGKRKKGKWSK